MDWWAVRLVLSFPYGSWKFQLLRKILKLCRPCWYHFIQEHFPFTGSYNHRSDCGHFWCRMFSRKLRHVDLRRADRSKEVYRNRSGDNDNRLIVPGDRFLTCLHVVRESGLWCRLGLVPRKVLLDMSLYWLEVGFINSTVPVLQSEFSPKATRGLCEYIFTSRFDIIQGSDWCRRMYAAEHIKSWYLPGILDRLRLYANLHCFICLEDSCNPAMCVPNPHDSHLVHHSGIAAVAHCSVSAHLREVFPIRGVNSWVETLSFEEDRRY